MNLKKFLRKTFPSLFPFKTTLRTFKVLDELFHLICSESLDYQLNPLCLTVKIYFKLGVFANTYYYKNWFNQGQNTDYPCYNLKRKLIDNYYEAEVTYEGDLLPYIAVFNRDENSLDFIPDSEEGIERLPAENKDEIMHFMSQIQQAKELFALKDTMKKGVQHA